MKKSLFLLAWAICFMNSLYAQKTGSISGILIDGSDRTALRYATAAVYKTGDSVLTAYKLSDTKGLFKIGNLQTQTKYRLVITAWQYEVLRKDFILNDTNPNLNLDSLKLTKKINDLEEVVIMAERPPVIVRKDTVEFNAESFKTLPAAVVEDLLKKLPGVSVGQDGEIQVNGKAVSKILVDGKEFFGGDKQLATKNLPANIIDKVQISADQEALRRDPELTEANIPQVINLKLKKAIKQGAFGKLYAGGGLNSRYETGGILNIFRDTTQVSVLAYGNNVNKAGFTMGDIQRIGGFNRSGFNSIMITSNGGFELNGISFGGIGSGIMASSGAGANFNTLTKSGIKLNTQYFFGQTNSDLNQQTNNNQSLGNDALISNSQLLNLSRNYSHRVSGRMEWKVDSLTKLILNPMVNLTFLQSDRNEEKTNQNNAGELINASNNSQQLNQKKMEYNISGDLYRDFRKKGRTATVSLELTKTDNTNDNFNLALNQFYLNSSSSILDQYRNTQISNHSASARMNFTEPFSKKLSLKTAANSRYINNENALYTFYRNPANQNYDIAVPQFSETVQQSGWKTNMNVRLDWKPVKELTVTPGLVYNTISLTNQFIKYEDFKQGYSFVAPDLNIRYKSLSLNYSPSFREPDVQYIQPVVNNTDPLFIQQGNPNLLPAKSHQIYLSSYKYDTKRSLNHSLYLGGVIQNNAIIMSRTIDQNGIQTSFPINANGVWSFQSSGNIRKEFKIPKRQISIGLGYNLNYNKDILMVNNLRSKSNRISVGPSANTRINLNDKIEFNQRYQVSINNSSYEDPFFRDMRFLTHNSETELIVRFPKKLVWESNFIVTANNQQMAGYSNTIKSWNAGVTYLFMKNDRAQLKLTINDILQSNVSRTRFIQQNYIIDRQTNNLGRFALLNLTYNIQNFGQKVGGKERFFGF